MDEIKAPEIKNFEEITPELFKEYVTYIETLRHNQRRWFRMHNIDALGIARQMEYKLDDLNKRLLDDTPKLFDL